MDATDTGNTNYDIEVYYLTSTAAEEEKWEEEPGVEFTCDPLGIYHQWWGVLVSMIAW